MRINLPKHTKGFLLLVGAFFTAIGALALYSPVDIASTVGLQALSVSARNEVRAIFGGVYLVFGLYFLWTAFQAKRRPAVKVAALFLGGLLLGRVISLFADGMTVNLWIWIFSVAEAVLAGVGLWVLYTDRNGKTA